MLHDLTRRIRTAKCDDEWRMPLIESKGRFKSQQPGFTFGHKPVPGSSRGYLLLSRIDPDNKYPKI